MTDPTLRRTRSGTRRAVLAPFALFVMVFACTQGLRPPEVAPSNTLGMSEIDPDDVDQGPLRVLYASPKGKLDGPSEITVLFSKPMRALELAGNEAPFGARVEPAISGTWQWVGTRAGSFIPARPEGGGELRLPHATAFTVTVPKGTRSLDGDSLSEDYTFSFETERPELRASEPGDGFEHLQPDSTIDLAFNVPITDSALQKSVRLLVGGKPRPFGVERPKKDDPTWARIVPSSPLPLDAQVQVEVGEDLATTEGPLLSGAGKLVDLRTYGPLRVSELRCSNGAPGQRCSSDSPLSLSFSNGVRVGDVKKALRVDPPVKLAVSDWLEDDDVVGSMSVSGAFKPGTSYTFRLSGGVKDEFDQTLAAAFSSRVEFGDLWPIARIGLSSGILEPGSKREVTVGHINTSDLEIGALALGEDDILAMQDESLDVESLFGKKGAVTRKIPGGTKNVLSRARISADEVLGSKTAKGAFAVFSRYTIEPSEKKGDRPRIGKDRSVAQITDLGISAKVSRTGTLVLVTRLSDATPVAGAEVKIARKGAPPAVATTDAEGFAKFSGAEFTPRFEDERAVVFVKKDDDRAYRAVSDNVEDGLFDPGEDGTVGLLFTDRGIYRPGDTAHLKGIYRSPADKGLRTPPAGRPITVRVQGPGGDDVATLKTTTSRFGTFDVEVKLPASIALGQSYVTASDEAGTVATTELEVSEYRAAEFKVSAESDKPSYVRGDSAKWIGRGDFFFGAPMKGAQASLAVYRSETYFSPPGHDGFEFDDRAYTSDLPDASAHSDEVQTATVALDATGAATLGAKLELPGQTGPEQVTCNVDVTDVTRQVISSSTTALVHPASHYVGVSLDDWFVSAKTKLSPKFVAAAPGGEKVAGARIDAVLMRRSWAVAKQGSGGGGSTTVANVVDTPVATCKLVSTRSPVSCDLVPTEAGYYVLRVSSEDAKGNKVSASRSLYVLGDSASPLSLFRDSDSTSLELITDKKTYGVGQKAKILVKSPWTSAEALVTVERSGIYEKRRVKLVGRAPTIEIPITEDLRPNAFVSVLLLKGRSAKAPTDSGKPDVGAPAYRLGFANLMVDPEERRLKVEVAPAKTDYRPGDEVAVTLSVRDLKGKPATTELTVYAVDEGVLSLIDYKTPDPISVFGQPRGLHVATLEARGDLASVFDPLSGLGLDKGLAGGGGGESASPSRKDFRAAAYWNPSVVTDVDGKAEVRFKLPDSLTTYRIMAVASAMDDRFGKGDARVTSSRPLMARPALPRFLRAGDAFDASIIVTSKSAVAGDIDVTAKLTGVSMSGDASQRVHVAPGESVEVRYPVVASRVGEATFRFDVKGAGETDSVTAVRKVTPPLPLEAVALYGATAEAAAEKLGDLRAIRDDVGELTLTTSSTALVGLDGGASQLLDYPYGCTEQLASKLVPLVSFRDLAKEFGVALPANADAVADKTVALLISHQRGDGGFGFWEDSPRPNAWATAYALWGLGQAKAHGVAVPKQSLEDGARYLRNALQSPEDDFALGVGPLAVDVLAELGMPDPGYTAKLFERRSDMPLYSRAILLHALVASKSSPEMVKTLSTEIEASLRLDGALARSAEPAGTRYGKYLDSEVRTNALVLRGLVAARPGHPLAAPLARGILADRRGAAWNTTQETAWALVGLTDFHRAQEKEEPRFVARTFFGEELAAEQAFSGRSLEPKKAVFPAAQLLAANGAPMTFQVEGDGKLYYEARLRYARRELPKAPLDRGFFVEKKMRVVDPAKLSEALGVVPEHGVTAFAGGDLVLVDLVVVSPKPRSFVAIDDPLPAGLEAIDARLSTSSGRLGQLEARRNHHYDDEDDDGSVATTYYTKEVRDDRVLFFVDSMPAGVFRYRYLARATALGTFVTPPSRAEEMYQPEIFGRTPAATVTITPKAP